MTAPEILLARYLRQRQELGDDALIVERDRLVRLLRYHSPAALAPSPAGLGSTTFNPAPDASPARTQVRTEAAGSPLEALATEAATCTACGLCTTRSSVVFGEGHPAARVVVVGEAPGSEEDRTGRPFVGRAGKLLNTLLLSVGFERENVYICNVLKCRPPGNRDPLPEEVESCARFLRGQLELVRPEAILAVGAFPAKTLLHTTEPIGRLRGRVHGYEGIPLVPTYHPAALLRNPGWIRPVWEDLQRLREVLDG